MLTIEMYKNITQRYGAVASWAVWGEFGNKPKANMSDMSVFAIDQKNDLLNTLNPNVIMVGLNFARPVSFSEPYMNFHDPSPYANDFKIRFAFKNTPFYGAYMTDIIKDYPEVNSKNVEKHIKINPDFLKESIKSLSEELIYIGSKDPIVFCFGSAVYNLLKTNLDANLYDRLVPLTHYSHQISKEKYKAEVMQKIAQIPLVSALN